MRSIYTLFCCMVMFLTSSQLSATSFEVVNTGSNMTVFILPGAIMSGDVADVSEIGIFYTNDSGDLVCAGASPFINDGSPFQISLWATEDSLDNGMAPSEVFTWLARSADDVIYDVTASYFEGSPNFVLNGFTSVDSMEFTVQTVIVPGCMDEDAFNFNELATESDDSCVPVVTGCTDTVATNYDSSANTAGDCTYAPTTATVSFTVDMNGVEQPSAEYDNVVVNGSWNGWQGWGVTLADADADGIYTGSLEVEPNTTFEYVVAVTGPADNWSGWGIQWGDGCANANVFATSGEISSVTASSLTPGCAEILGCMDVNASNYDSTATQQSVDTYGNLLCLYASCDDIPEYGCIYADSYSPFTADFGADACSQWGTPCEEVLGCTDSTAVNYNSLANSDDSSCIAPVPCAALDFSAENTGVNMTLFITGDAITADLSPGDMIGVFYTSDEGDLVSAGSSVWTGSAMQVTAYGDDATTTAKDGFVANEAIVWKAQNSSGIYDLTPTYSNSSVVFASNGLEFVQSFNYAYSCSGTVPSGCTDTLANNFDSAAAEDDGSCSYDLSGCMDGHYLEYNPAANISNQSLCITWKVEGCSDSIASNFDSAVNFDDGSCIFPGCTDSTAFNFDSTANSDDNSCVAVVVGCVDTTASNYSALVNTPDNSSCVSWEELAASLQSQLDAVVPEDGISQADVDAQADLSYGYGYGEGYGAGAASVTPDDGVSQADVDSVQALLDAVVPDDGISQADVDAQADLSYGYGYGEGYGAGAASVTPDDGVSQADVDSVEVLLTAALESACSPIFVDIVAGWNILGYTLPVAQDVAATLNSIEANILIVKDNDAEVYWPEFGFNGIGDFTPGQGYQIKTDAAIANYTWPSTDERVSMSVTVPQWAVDMEVDVHPNDVKSLVKVVNMLGQEINVEDQFKGEVVLYLYNDGTVEKKIVQ